MTLTDEQIRGKALELANAGVGQKDIEAWIDLARQERNAVVAKESKLATTTPPIELPNPTAASSLSQSYPAPASSAEQTAADIAALKGVGASTAENVLRGAAITAGQAAGLRAPGMLKAVAVPLGGAASAMAADYALQQASGQPYRIGQTIGEGMVGTLPMIGTSPTAMATARTIPRMLEFFMSPQGFRTLSTIYGSKAAQTMIDERRVPTTGEVTAAIAGTAVMGATKEMPQTSKQKAAVERMVNDAETNTNAREWIAKGGKIDPTLTYRDSAINRGLSEISGGSIEVQRVANEANQRLVNKLAREDLGIQTGLSPIAIQDRITKLSASQRDIAGLGGSFATKLDEVRMAREEARDAWNSYKNAAASGKPSTEARNEAKKLTQDAVAAEDSLHTMLINAGHKDLAKQYVRDRADLATAYAYKDALIEGNVSPGIISDYKRVQGRHLTGNLDLIARVHDSMPKVMRDITAVQPVTQNLQLALARLGGGAASATAGMLQGGDIKTGAVAGAIGAFSPEMARGTMMSPFYQRLMAAPRYGTQDPAFMASIARFAGMNALNQ